MDYDAFFRCAFDKASDSSFKPYPYQRRLAVEPWPHLLDVPTGMGKTAAVIFGWAWKRGWRPGTPKTAPDPDTPRRLVYCLPMRVLVEQTYRNACEWLHRLGFLSRAGEGKVSVHLLMGGAEDVKTWAEYPEEDMILIGTQDMLLSRALMRGYGMSRYQWPVHFGLLHNDALWLFDEVQLMGAGLATSAQLEAFRRRFPLAAASRSLWLSATLNTSWLATVDLEPHLTSLKRLSIGDADRAHAGGRLNAVKALSRASFTLGETAESKKGADIYLRTLCDAVLKVHDPAGQTLVIVNRVDRAQGLFRLLRQQRASRPDVLVHARFRPQERVALARRLREDLDTDRIVIATQAIEAGVDISSRVLVTELAPWSSLVQRFGRCNRYGEHNASGGARIIWIDIDDGCDPAPYQREELHAARAKLSALASASPENLPRTDDVRSVGAVLRRKDLLDLCNTDPDLSGFDVDISDYIRDSGVPGLQVFWRDFSDPNLPEPQTAPQHGELCPISIGQAQSLTRRDAWYWDSLGSTWAKLQSRPRPGMTLLLRAQDGRYDTELGFYAGSDERVSVIPVGEERKQAAYGTDWRSQQRHAVLLHEHLGNVAKQMKTLCEALGDTVYSDVLIRAARWHDVGKAHNVFDATMHCCDRAPSGYLAKSPCRGRHYRPFFRHELASMLAWLAQHDGDPNADLIAYLIAAHHGKVRMSLRAMPTEQADDGIKRFARGVWEGDMLPAIEFDGERSAEVTLRLALMEIGEGEQGASWTARTLKLLDEHGAFRLAWLETLVRLADWRASAAEQLEREGNRNE